jgi:FkbM family methyltransferase
MYKAFQIMKNIIRRFVLVLRGIAMFKDWQIWLLARLGLSRRSGIGMFRMRDGTAFAIDFSHNNVGTFQEVWLMDLYEKYQQIRPKDIVIDIGASIGAFSVLAAKRGARVYAYEPTPRSFKLLMRNIIGNNVVAYELAVASKIGHAEFFETGGDEGNSLLPLRGAISSFRVATTTLDYIIEQVGHCNFLKMDCEGGELAILENVAATTLKKIDYIAMEYHQNLPRVETILKNHGFHVRVEGEAYGYVYASREDLQA